MGTLCTRHSEHLSKSPTIDSSTYLLDKSPVEKTSYDFDVNRLNFIPDSEQLWDSPVIVHVPPTTSILERSNSPTYTNSPTKMPTQLKYKCDQCGMVFPSDDSLFKHKTRFCIGVKDSGIGRKPVYSDDEELDHPTTRSTRRKVIQHHSPVEKKREEVNDWKQQRAILQTVEDMEDRILTDTYQTQKLTNNIKKQDNIYNEILLEYERLQTQERDVLRQMYNLQVEPKSTNVKQTIDLSDIQKNDLEELQKKNLRLERERRLIQQKLEELISTNYQPTTMSNYQPYRFLREMKEQHELNEKALSFLQGRLIYHDTSLSSVSDIPTLPYLNTRYTRLQRTGGDQVRTFRNTYLQSGGHDANVIARYTDIENRLRTYEDYPWTTNYPEPLKQSRYQPDRSFDVKNERLKLVNGENEQLKFANEENQRLRLANDENQRLKLANEEYQRLKLANDENQRLKLANEENQRLQDELNQMHRKFETLNTRTRQLEYAMTTSRMPNSTDNQRHLSAKTDFYPQSQPSVRDSDQFDQRQHYQQTSLPLLDKRVTPRASPAMSLLTSNMNKLRDPLAPQPYDPIGGFVIFFDFIVSLPQTINQCCLVTCLYHPKSGLGEPSQLEPFKCEQYFDEKNGERMSVALIATKQPVPRCPPQQALTVVIEIQTLTNQQASSNEELRTTAWTKLPLFDNKNRLLSGRWKVPLRALPIHHSESLAVISTLPTYDHAELHYRLVNSQDGDDQSHAPLSPSFRDLYIYPLQSEDQKPKFA